MGLGFRVEGFPKSGVPSGVPRNSIVVFWGLCWGPLIEGNYQCTLKSPSKSLKRLKGLPTFECPNPRPKALANHPESLERSFACLLVALTGYSGNVIGVESDG